MRTFFLSFFLNFIMHAQRCLGEVNKIKLKTRKLLGINFHLSTL